MYKIGFLFNKNECFEIFVLNSLDSKENINKKKDKIT